MLKTFAPRTERLEGSRMARSHRAAATSRRYVPSHHPRSLLHPRTFWALIRKTVSKWNDDPTLRFGAGLAYYTAFAVVPLVFIVVELATLMVGTNAAEGLLMEQVERLIGEQGAQAIHHLLDSWQKNGVGGVAAVVEVAIANDADLVVVGKRPHGWMADAILGEVANQVVHHPACPIVVVPTDAREPERPALSVVR